VAELTAEVMGEDRLRVVQAAGTRSPIVLASLTVDGRPHDPKRLLLGSVWASAATRLPLVLNPTALLVAELGIPQVAGAPPLLRVAVQAVLKSPQPAMTIDAETARHLQELGYAQ
jgi:hypothetical protein